MSRPALALVALAVLLAGCGAPGDPLPPSLNIPERITDLRARQQGELVIVEFTLPALTTDGLALRRLPVVELRAGPPPEGYFDTRRWAAQAQPIPVQTAQPGPARVSFPARPWVGRELVLGVRAAGPKGRLSEWSNLAVVPVVPPLETPAELRAESAPAGVRLRWAAARTQPQVRFRIFRREAEGQDIEPIGESDKPEFTDPGAAFGRRFEYCVQAFLKTGDSEAVSELSQPVSITPVDRFPPAAPRGLRVAAGLRGVELAWDPNTEPDLRGYRVWRAAEGEALAPLSNILELPSYSDRNTESGKRYRYAVTAVDADGNESAPSSPVEVTAP